MTRGPSTRLIAILGVVAAILILLVALAVIRSSDSRGERSSARITELHDRVAELEDLVTTMAAENAALRTVVEALTAQIENEGGEPVVRPVVPPATTPAGTTPPTTSVPPPVPSCGFELLGLCIG